MTGCAIQFFLNLVGVRRVHLVHHRMAIDRMSQAVLDRDDGYFREIVLRQLHLSVEDGYHVLGFQLLRLGIRPMALQAKRIRIARPQQVEVFAAVWLVARRAALFECRLMQMRFLHLFGLFAMTGEAGI